MKNASGLDQQSSQELTQMQSKAAHALSKMMDQSAGHCEVCVQKCTGGNSLDCARLFLTALRPLIYWI